MLRHYPYCPDTPRHTRCRGVSSILWAGLFATLSNCLPASAIELPTGSQINGFVQQGFLWSDNNDFNGESDDKINRELTYLGATFAHHFQSPFSFNAQVISSQIGDIDNGEPFVDYGYVTWHGYQSMNQRLDVHLGRVVIQYGFYNELRDISLSRPSIFAPYSVYYERIRRSISGHDGVSFKYQHLFGFDTLEWEGGIANPRSARNDVRGMFPENNFDGSANGQEAYFSRFVFEQPLKSRYALSYTFLRWDFDGNFNTLSPFTFTPISIPISGSASLKSYGISAQRTYNFVTIATELFRHNIHYDGLIAGNDLKLNINSAYIQAQIGCGPLQCLLQHEWFMPADNDLLPLDTTLDTGTGVTWNITPQFAWRLEYHSVRGRSWLSPTETFEHKNWHYIVTQFAWTF